MKLCVATLKSGRNCLNKPIEGSEHCRIHQGNISKGQVLPVAMGSLIGNVVFPGMGGLLIGGIFGSLAQSIFNKKNSKLIKVFVSFDYDHDRALKDFILGQTKLKNCPFKVINRSLNEAVEEDEWENKARLAIKQADIVLVIVGRYTHKAKGVLKEVSMARNEGVKIVQIKGYKNKSYKPVPQAGKLYVWNWGNLKMLLTI